MLIPWTVATHLHVRNLHSCALLAHVGDGHYPYFHPFVCMISVLETIFAEKLMNSDPELKITLKDKILEGKYISFINSIKLFTKNSWKIMILGIYIPHYCLIVIHELTNWKLVGDVKRAYYRYLVPLVAFLIYAYVIMMLKLAVSTKSLSSNEQP